MNKNFMPNLLPIEDTIILDKEIMELSHLATSSIDALNSNLSKSSLGTNLLMMPLINQEAVSSTRIEGTQVDTREIYEIEASPSKNTRDTQEALNYIKAIEMGKGFIKDKGKITEFLIRGMHKELLSRNVRGNNKNPGEFKVRENYIGKTNSKREQAEYIPPGPEHTVSLIENLLEYLNSEVDDNFLLIKLSILHAQFETIHPFEDGNGRIGRVLIPLFLYYKGKTSDAYFFMSKNLEKNKYQYYNNLNETRWPNNWKTWITFFLSKIIEQVEETNETINDVDKMFIKDLKVLKNKHRSYLIEEYLRAVYRYPIFTNKLLSKNCGIVYNTCREFTKTLIEHKVIYPDDNKRNIKYYHYKLLDIITK